MTYSNFHVLTMIPIFSFVCDSLLLHIASIIRLHPFQELLTYLNFLGVIIISGCCAVLVFTDYRLERPAAQFALGALALESLSRVLMMLGSNVQEQRRESKSFLIYERLVIGIPQLLIAGIAAFKYENTHDAFHRFKSWPFISSFWTLLPAVILLLVFTSGIYSVYRGPISKSLISVLEDGIPQARQALEATLHVGYFLLAISAFRRETTILNWFQAMAFTTAYVVALGPVHVGQYPQRLHNWIAHLTRRRQRHVALKSWSLLAFLVGSSVVVWAILTCCSVYWINTIAYNRSAKGFHNPSRTSLDYAYRPPRIRGLEIIIAHSKGHTHDSLWEMVDRIRESKPAMGLGPLIKVYTKDPELLKQADQKHKDELHIEVLKNVGGTAATFLHYITTKWDTLPTQTLFLATSPEPQFDPRFIKRVQSHFAGQGFPIADAEPKTGFLSLGESETCDCQNCVDSHGWEDKFGLVPSMWTAARPNQTNCETALLTYSNNFFASSARIRGIKKDIWELILTALTRTDVENSWAHEKEKLPVMYEGERKVGKWGKGGVYEVADSLETPILGKTMERLWGVFLQCSTVEVAWRCPNLQVGESKIQGEKGDCGCIDELAPGFL